MTDERDVAAMNGTPGLAVTYRNWRGEVRERQILPTRVWYGMTEHHPEPQWLLDAVDLQTGKLRSFAFLGFEWPRRERIVSTAWRCDGCGETATRSCAAEFLGFVCGFPLCARCGHHDRCAKHSRAI